MGEKFLVLNSSSEVLDVPPGMPLAESEGRTDAQRDGWKKVGAGFLLQATAAQATAAELPPKAAVTLSLLDLASGRTLLERTYRQDLRYQRSLAHQISNDVVFQLTGRSGIAHTRLAFAGDRSGHKEICLVDYDGGNLRQLTRDASIALLPRWSPDGRTILYTGYRLGNPDLWEVDLPSGRLRALSDRQGLNLAGGFSPDGGRLALTLSKQKSPNIYLLELSSGALRRLTDHFGVDSSPTFSPGGEQIAFVSDRSGNPQVHTLDLSTGRIRRLTGLNWCDSPSWSPGGEWIVFSGRANPKDRMDLFLVDVTGEQIRQLTHGEGSNEDPSWSADGRFIAFTTTRNERRELFVMDSDGGAPRAVGEIPGNAYTPHWSR